MISLILAAQENQPNYIIQALDKVFGCRYIVIGIWKYYPGNDKVFGCTYFVIGIWKLVHGIRSLVIVNNFSDSELVVGFLK